MDALNGVVAMLRADPALAGMLDGGIWTGTVPGTLEGPENDTPGGPMEDYMVVTPLTMTKGVDSTSVRGTQTISVGVFAADRADGTDAMAKVRAVIGRVEEMFEEADRVVFVEGGEMVSIGIAAVMVLPGEEMGWQGTIDLALRTERARKGKA